MLKKLIPLYLFFVISLLSAQNPQDEKLMGEIIINEFEIDHETVVWITNKLSIDLDKKDVKIALNIDRENLPKLPRLTMSFREIPLQDLLRYICFDSGLKCIQEGRKMTITDKAEIDGKKSFIPLPAPGSRSKIREKMKKMVFNNIKFDDVPLTDVLIYFQEQSRILDEDKAGINFFLNLSNDPRKISVTTEINDNIPLMEMIKYICKVAGLSYKIEPHAVLIENKRQDSGKNK